MNGTTSDRHHANNGSHRPRQTQISEEPTLADVAVDASESLRVYARKRPEVVAMWCVGLGFVLGWKLKRW
jgi:hypothetical protein